MLTLELISTGVKFLYWTPQECVRTGSLCKGHQTKMLPTALFSTLNRWEGAKDATGLLVIHFTIVKKKTQHCAIMDLLS